MNHDVSHTSTHVDATKQQPLHSLHTVAESEAPSTSSAAKHRRGADRAEGTATSGGYGCWVRQRFAAPGKRPAERCFPCRAIAADATVAIHARSIPGSENEPPDFGPPLHLHRDAAEAFYVLEGEYLMFIEDEQQLCPPGTFVHVPKNRPHTFKVVSDGPGTKLNLFSPAAMVRYFEELAAAEAAGRVTPELLDGIADRSNVEVLGPVPDTYL